MKMTYKMKGLDELNANLRALGKEVATKAGKTAARKGAQVIQKAVKANAPTGTQPTQRTWKTKSGEVHTADYGRLRDNIRVKKIRAKKLHTVSYVITTGRAFWGQFAEFGTVKEEAQPFFKPALDTSVPEALRVIADELGKAIRKIGRKAGKKR